MWCKQCTLGAFGHTAERCVSMLKPPFRERLTFCLRRQHRSHARSRFPAGGRTESDAERPCADGCGATSILGCWLLRVCESKVIVLGGSEDWRGDEREKRHEASGGVRWYRDATTAAAADKLGS